MTSLQGSHVREKTAFKKRGHNGTETQWDGDTMGRGHSGTGAQWDGGTTRTVLGEQRGEVSLHVRRRW